MEYIIVKSNCFNELERFVNSKIKSGYVPIGGVSYSGALKFSDGVFLQAMIKE